ncbi:uncharacterized protein LOC126744242 isoform X2 [Anthonomus grandis grandis]|uniref:uncharacterized protein LOC126744242 isoform X2 n=1 Tax=Anthonomus grandis grandis TaxID=2921223 RepID=UPI002166A432|nr:uncharacterized protein LOC126744242 isoform X2 [Anthonomus grandis grandis]
MEVTYFIIFALAISSVFAVDNVDEDKQKLRSKPPTSPCPDVFNYEPEYVAKSKMGLAINAYINLKKPAKAEEAELKIHLQVPGILSELNGENKSEVVKLTVLTKPQDLINDKKRNLYYKLELRPTKSRKILQPYLITLNGETVCEGERLSTTHSGLIVSITASLEGLS